MARLLDDLLDVSAHHPRQASSCAASAIDAAPRWSQRPVEMARPLIDAARHRARRVDCRPSRSGLDADPVRLAQVFANLLHQRGQVHRRRAAGSRSAASRGGEAARRGARHGHRHRAARCARRSSRCSRRSSRPARRARRAGSASASRWCAAWSSCTAAASRRDSDGPGTRQRVRRALPLARPPQAGACRAAAVPPRPTAAPRAGRRRQPRRAPTASRDAAARRATTCSVAYDGDAALALADARARPTSCCSTSACRGSTATRSARRMRASAWGRRLRADRAHRLGPGRGPPPHAARPASTRTSPSRSTPTACSRCSPTTPAEGQIDFENQKQTVSSAPACGACDRRPAGLGGRHGRSAVRPGRDVDG